MPILKKKQKQMHPARFLLMGFSAIILLGAILLAMPFSSASGNFSDFFDCLFTAASATCVTGITVFDTYHHFSWFGQGVILALIQVGGMGFLAFVTFINLMLGKKMGWSAMKMTAGDVTDSSFGDAGKLIKEIFTYTFAIEFIGAAVLCIAFVPRFGGYGVFMAIFTAVSAFCNAGFDLMTISEGAVGMSRFTGDPLVMLTLIVLIILGGLGFVVWQNIRHYNKVHRFNLHTRVVFIMTVILVLGGMLAVFICEFSNENTIGNMPLGEKLLTSLFVSVSSRSAGFACFDIDNMTAIGKVFVGCLMFIGAAPASTGGGIKITTIAIIIASVLSVLKGSEDTTILGHRLKHDAVLKTLTVTVLSVLTVSISCLLVMFNSSFSMQDIMFEVVSVFSTTGYSAGVCNNMSLAVKIIMVITMFVGRLGPITLMMSLMIKTNKSKNNKNKILPEGDILVG